MVDRRSVAIVTGAGPGIGLAVAQRGARDAFCSVVNDLTAGDVMRRRRVMPTGSAVPRHPAPRRMADDRERRAPRETA